MSDSEFEPIEETSAISEVYLFADESETFSCIASLFDEDAAIQNASLQRLREVFDKYLECPTLLDPLLERMVHQLALMAHSVLERQNSSSSEIGVLDPAVRYPLSALYALSKVRGRKLIQRFLNHQVDDVQLVWNGLKASSSALANEQDEGTELPPAWESVYMLWNWMNVLSLVPFDSDKLANGDFPSTLIKEATLSLSESGPIREAAAACLASWLSRPDFVDTHLPNFLKWTQNLLGQYMSHDMSSSTLFKVLGALQTATSVLKQSPAQREHLVACMSTLWEPLLQLADHVGEHNLLLRKLLVKWWTRMCCAHLPPHVATWRYNRGKRSLVANLQSDQAQDVSVSVTQEENFLEVDSRELFFVPDHVEEGVGRLIEALGNSSTMVRWSAAKGVGRITERLPAVCGEDVLDAILEFFEEADKDNRWHGACLALAELARRGLLLQHWLSRAMPNVVLAVQYEVPRGQRSVGAHVRDAACYTYWAFARSYSPSVLQPYLSELNESIIMTSLFDREVNCRRAASAAFQEAVGRQGAHRFPHGIDILTTADYFTLGNRTNAYLSIARSIAHFDEYRRPIIRHLFVKKLGHWDINVRELAAKSLRGLTDLDPSFMANEVVSNLLGNVFDDFCVNQRHGALLGLAETLFGLSDVDDVATLLSETDLETIKGLVATIERKRLYRGRGGAMMRQAVCRLVESISCSRISLSVQQQIQLLDTVDSCISNPSHDIQTSACQALGRLFEAYFPVREAGPTNRLQNRVIDKFVKMVSTSDNPGSTRGYALALGFLPAKLLAPRKEVLDCILSCLCSAAHQDALVGGEPDAETRRNALLSIGRISSIVGLDRLRNNSVPYPLVCLDEMQVRKVFDTFLLALSDYKSDRRGDVGSWSRLAAMDGLVSLFLATANVHGADKYFDSTEGALVVGGLLKQLSERLTSCRQRAGTFLEQLLSKVDATRIPLHSELVTVLDIKLVEADRDWGDPCFAFQRTLAAASLGEDIYLFNVVSGICQSLGGLTKSVEIAATDALLQWVARGKGSDIAHKLGGHVLFLLIDNAESTRVVLPVLRTLKLLLSHRSLNDVLVADDSEFARELFVALADIEHQCNDVPTILALIDACTLLLDVPIDEEIRNMTLGFVCKMLRHRFPRIRVHAAEQLYMIIADRTDLVAEIGSDSVLNLVLSSPWASQDVDLKAAAEHVVSGLQVRREYEMLLSESFGSSNGDTHNGESLEMRVPGSGAAAQPL